MMQIFPGFPCAMFHIPLVTSAFASPENYASIGQCGLDPKGGRKASPTQIIDLRSDTVTQPTADMRRAMETAYVGDDAYGEDPTVNYLQDMAAKLLGKEASLFMPSGTMANQVALRLLSHPGDVVIAAQDAHVIKAEEEATTILQRLGVKTIGTNGHFTADEIKGCITAKESHGVVVIENTHTASGGTIFPFDSVETIAKVAKEAGLHLHLDGARLFNAVVTSGIPAHLWAEPFDTVSFCLSKGLGAPIGSLLCSSQKQIDRARQVRKLFGGGMRQVGVLAAAGIYALQQHVERLEKDHYNAKKLAHGLQKLGLDVSEPQTNIVLFRVQQSQYFVEQLRKGGVLVKTISENVIRAMTHLDISEADIDRALMIIKEAGQ